MPDITVNLIGAGRVGQTLLALLQGVPGYWVQDVLSRRPSSAAQAVAFAGAGRAVADPAQLRPADLWVVAVPDTQIAQAAQDIAGVAAQPLTAPPPVVFHCSGFYASDQLAPLRDLGWHAASVHPVLSFADPAEAVRQFPGTFCGVEGDAQALAVIDPMLTAMGAVPFPIRSDSKSLYHAAAVLSNNFTVVLQALARQAWAEAGVPDEIAQGLNDSLLRATYENVAAKGPWEALTGPAARGDTAVVRQQGADVARWHPVAGRLYRDMSDLARQMKATPDKPPKA